VDFAGRLVLEPRSGCIREVQRNISDDHLVGGGATQLAV
jgi:hypothetical protein